MLFVLGVADVAGFVSLARGFLAEYRVEVLVAVGVLIAIRLV